VRVNTNENGCAGRESFFLSFSPVPILVFLLISPHSFSKQKSTLVQLHTANDFLLPFTFTLSIKKKKKKKKEIEASKREQLRTSALQVQLYIRLKIFLFFTLFVVSLCVSFFISDDGPLFFFFAV
jgi:hypothetical protein